MEELRSAPSVPVQPQLPSLPAVFSNQFFSFPEILARGTRKGSSGQRSCCYHKQAEIAWQLSGKITILKISERLIYNYQQGHATLGACCDGPWAAGKMPAGVQRVAEGAGGKTSGAGGNAVQFDTILAQAAGCCFFSGLIPKGSRQTRA
ncbi:MAG: hypothetical protein WCD46_08260, partial [Desulfobacterales bacterium]